MQSYVQLWKARPDCFVIDALKATPEPWQSQVLAAAAAGNERISIRSGHGVGKTALLSWIVLWFLCTHFPCKIGCTAPTSHQLRDILWPEIGLWFARLPLGLQQRFVRKQLRIENVAHPDLCFAVGRTARREQPEALQGLHSPNTLIVVDEASGVDDRIFDVALGSMSTPGAVSVLAGNPTRLAGFFFDTHGRLSRRWDCHQVSSEQVARARGHIEDIVARYGRESNAYRVRVLGEFPTAEEDSVIARDLCDAAVARLGTVVPISHIAPVWGVDVARFGDDRSALAKRQGNVLLGPVESWRSLDTMQTAGRIHEQWKATSPRDRPARVVVDVVGLGAGVADRLRELGLPVTGINVGESASNGKRYRNLRDELWFLGREWLEGRDTILPADTALIAELTAPHYSYASSGQILVESKDEMKRRGLASPDLADAFLLTFAVGDHAREVRPAPRHAPHGLAMGRAWKKA